MASPWVHEMVERLHAADVRERRPVFDAYMQMTGKSRAQLYRLAGAHGFHTGRAARADRGRRRSGLTDDQLTFVAGVLQKTGRENKGPIMPIDAALEIAVDNGIIEPGQASASTVARHLRELQMSKERMKDPTPHTEMASLHPNHCHLADVSVCIQYYLRDGRMGIMDERDFYKNKPDAFGRVKQKLLRYVLTDHFSHYFLVKYYIAEGESRQNLWDFLLWCWRRKADSRLAMFGVPYVLLMDAGSAQQSHALRNFFAGLGVERPKGRPYNPRRQGSVEGTHTIIENRFETRLRICPAFDVDQLNEWAADFTIHHAATRTHSRHGMTRLGCWQLIKPENLRELPGDDVLSILYAEPAVECTVRNYQFSYRGETYRVKHLDGMHHNAKVTVRVNPYRWQQEKVVSVLWRDACYEVQAVRHLPAELGGFSEHAAIIGQEYKAQPQTETQRAGERINQIAHGETAPKKGAIPFEGLTVMGHQADKVANLAALPKRGSAIEVARPTGPAHIPIMQLLTRLRDAGVTVTPQLNSELRETLGAALPVDGADEIVRALADGHDWRATEPAAVATAAL